MENDKKLFSKKDMENAFNAAENFYQFDVWFEEYVENNLRSKEVLSVSTHKGKGKFCHFMGGYDAKISQCETVNGQCKLCAFHK